MNNKKETGRADDDLPMWVVREETPQELIDQSWNPGRKNKYFKPPINAEESATYYDRYDVWQAKWRESEQSGEAELDPLSVIASLQAQVDSLVRRVSVAQNKDFDFTEWPGKGGGE